MTLEADPNQNNQYSSEGVDSTLRRKGIVSRTEEEALEFNTMTKEISGFIEAGWISGGQFEELARASSSFEEVQRIINAVAAMIHTAESDEGVKQLSTMGHSPAVLQQKLRYAETLVDGLHTLKTEYPELLDVPYVLQDF